MYWLWGIWGGRAGAGTPCQGRETAGMFVGLVPGLCLCSAAPSGTLREVEGGRTHCRGRAVLCQCSNDFVPAPPQGGQGCLSLPREERCPEAVGCPSLSHPAQRRSSGGGTEQRHHHLDQNPGSNPSQTMWPGR